MGLTSNQYFLFEESIKTTNGDKLFRRPKFRLGPKDRRNFDPGKRPPEFRPGAKDRRNFDPGRNSGGHLARAQIDLIFVIMINEINLGSVR